MSACLVNSGDRWLHNTTKRMFLVHLVTSPLKANEEGQVIYHINSGGQPEYFARPVSEFLAKFTCVDAMPHRNRAAMDPQMFEQPRPRSKEFADVFAFHSKFGLLLSETPRLLTKRKLKERVEFMQEELDEFIVAAGLTPIVSDAGDGGADVSFGINSDSQDLAGQADALIDLVYVACGTAVMLGLPWDWLWDDVQRANMAKVRGVTHRGHKVDVCKPPGWVGPQTTRILAIAGKDPFDVKEHDDAE